MKNKFKIIMLICIAILCFAGCGNGNNSTTASEGTTAPETTTTQEETSKKLGDGKKNRNTPMTVFYGDEEAEFIIHKTVMVSAVDKTEIVNQLILQNILTKGTKLNHFSKTDKSGKTILKLDFSKEFLDRLDGAGTAGERIIMGSVVNTFLHAYEADSVKITVDGKTIETGHTVYDNSQYEYAPGEETSLTQSISIGGSEKKIELLRIYNELGFAIDYDYEHFDYDFKEKTASFMVPVKVTKGKPNIYLSVQISDQKQQDIIDGLKLQAGKGTIEEKKTSFGTDSYSAVLLTVQEGKKSSSAITRYYVTTQNKKTYMIELGDYVAAETDYGKRLSMMLNTIRFVK